jgi:hypothetical protein
MVAVVEQVALALMLAQVLVPLDRAVQENQVQ